MKPNRFRSTALPALACVALAGCIPASGARPSDHAGFTDRSPAAQAAAIPPAQARVQPEARVIIPRPPAPPPAWEARPVSPDAAQIAASDYVVQPGDTLRSIGNRTGAGSEAIAAANALAAPYVLQPGQRLRIPGGRYHLVRPGETGIAIAQAYGIEWSRVIADNGLAPPYTLRLGQRLLVPAPLTLAQRARAFTLDIDSILTGGEPALAQNAQPIAGSPSNTRVLPPGAAVAAPARLTSNFAWPVHGSVVKRFGPGGSGERNDGIKIAVPIDTPVLAAADGVVVYVGSDIQAMGGLVILRHGENWTTVYGHAGQLLVQRGQAVKQGQTIALSGASGYADRPQLHFEMRSGRAPVDPLRRLPAA